LRFDLVFGYFIKNKSFDEESAPPDLPLIESGPPDPKT
jgi:hypothetical protein